MKKKIFGIKVGAILQFVLCVACAFVIWLAVQYTNMQDGASEVAIGNFLSSLLQ